MSVQQSTDLADALRLVERFPPKPRMPPAGLALRLKTSMAVRRLLPTPLVLARAIAKGHRLSSSSLAREHAQAAMAAIIAGTSSSGELADITREHLIEREALNALFWQPWTRPRVSAQSALRVRETLESGRGVLLSACHIGPYFRTATMLRSVGCTPYVVTGAWFFERPSHDKWGRRLARWRKGMGDVRLVSAKGSFAVVRALLGQGKCVLLYFDMPGRRQTRFLGKPTMLADGTARLAFAGDALVLPVRPRRVGRHVGLDVAEALDPREMAGVEDLHQALAHQHERWILEFPAAMDDPRSFGWRQGAREDAWVMPDHEAG
jgi:lauroyl/myristoyl acyltransferase